MPTYCQTSVIGLMLIFPGVIFAKDVYVRGYYRSNGTYVRPHIRSSPDQYKWNNYGPSQNTQQLMAPRQRDWDNDGIRNYLDRDDDNDGLLDDRDSNQYSPFFK